MSSVLQLQTLVTAAGQLDDPLLSGIVLRVLCPYLTHGPVAGTGKPGAP